jgi:alkaline phosphatase D
VRRLVVLAAVAILAVAGASADAASPGLRYGVAAGEITSTSAVLWTRAPRAGIVDVLVSESSTMKLGVVYRVVARASDDLTVSRSIALGPGRRYWYRFEHGSARSAVGTFRTPATSAASVRFAITGDADATPGPNGKPAFNSYGVYARMAAERNDFNINLGDTIYSDSEVGGAPVARTAAQKWGKYKLGLALPALRKLRASAGLYSHWDDHEFINDFSKPEHGDAIYDAGVSAFRDYAPVSGTGPLGPYRKFRWGSTSSSSSSTSARSARRRRPLCATGISRPPLRRQFATRSQRSPRRSGTPSRRPVSPH